MRVTTQGAGADPPATRGNGSLGAEQAYPTLLRFFQFFQENIAFLRKLWTNSDRF